MKKFTFIFAFVAMAFSFSFGQATFILNAPVNDGSTSGNRFPNGTSSHTYFRGASLVLASELSSIPASATLSTIGFTNVTAATATAPVTGSITIYMQNTSDVTFNKGTTWSGVTPGMTPVYVGTISIPNTVTAFDLTLTTPFAFTNGGLYVAYDFQSAGPFATGACIWASNSTGLPSGCISGPSATAPVTVCSTSSFRPCMRFGFPNSLTNDVSVETINTLGSVAQTLGLPVPVSAIVRNNSNTTLNNINVSANMTGANTYTDMQTVASIAAGATATVNFNLWTPLTMGGNTLNVSVPSDQVNTNNNMGFNTMVTCNTAGNGQSPASYTTSIGFNTASGILSTPLQAPIATTVTGVNIAISSNTASVGNPVYGVILDNTGTILANSTNTLTISNVDLNTITSFSFNPPVSVAASQLVYLGMAQTANATTGYYPFGSYPNAYLSTSYFTNAITGGTLAPLTSNLGQFGIEANFLGTCGPLAVKAIATADNNLTVYPNPASTTLNVKLGSVTDKATATVYNAIGQVVIASQEINNNAAEINVSSLSKGVYILKISNGVDVSNTKFVIER